MTTFTLNSYPYNVNIDNTTRTYTFKNYRNFISGIETTINNSKYINTLLIIIIDHTVL